MRIPLLLLALVVVGCSENRDQPEEVVRSYVQAADTASCRYLTPPRARACRRPHVPEPPAHGVVIEHVRADGNRATVRASYDWTGYRRHTTFALVRRDTDWLIAGGRAHD